MMTVGELRAALEGADDDSAVAMAITIGGCDEMVLEIGLDGVGEPHPDEEREDMILLMGDMDFRSIPLHLIDEIQSNIIAEECAFEAGARGWSC